MDNLTPHEEPSDRSGGKHRRASSEVDDAAATELPLDQAKAARMECKAQIARQALANAALLTKDEENFIMMAPLGESRYKAIVDAYTICVTWEIAGR